MKISRPIAGAALVAVLAAGVVASSQREAERNAARDLPPEGVQPSPLRDRPVGPGVDGPHVPEHCSGAESSLRDELSNEPNYAILLPATSVASQSSVSAVWACPGGGTRVEFESGIYIHLEGSDIDDPAESWEAAAAQAPEIYSVGVVQGVPAFLIDPAKDESGVALGGVTAVMEGDTLVTIVGNGKIPLSDLVEVADSLTASA